MRIYTANYIGEFFVTKGTALFVPLMDVQELERKYEALLEQYAILLDESIHGGQPRGCRK